jgi:hypothetical protein
MQETSAIRFSNFIRFGFVVGVFRNDLLMASPAIANETQFKIRKLPRENRCSAAILTISSPRRGETVKMQDHIVMQSDFEKLEYSSSSEKSQEDFRAILRETEALLSDLNMNPDFELESAKKLIAALDAADEKAIAIAADAAGSGLLIVSVDWLTKFRELARDHGPFGPQEAVQIIHELNRCSANENGR